MPTVQASHRRCSAGLNIKSKISREASMSCCRACIISGGALGNIEGPSTSNEGWGWPLETRKSLTSLAALEICAARSRRGAILDLPIAGLLCMMGICCLLVCCTEYGALN